jgi:phosphoribosylformylglycinamidine synthase
MSRYQAQVSITPRAGLLDPEGHAVEGALRSLNFTAVCDVRVGRLVHITLDAASEGAARTALDAMCRSLLANPVTEDYSIALEQTA